MVDEKASNLELKQFELPKAVEILKKARSIHLIFLNQYLFERIRNETVRATVV